MTVGTPRDDCGDISDKEAYYWNSQQHRQGSFEEEVGCKAKRWQGDGAGQGMELSLRAGKWQIKHTAGSLLLLGTRFFEW